MSTEDWVLWIFLFVMFFGGGVRVFINDRIKARERRREVEAETKRRALEGPVPMCGCGHHHAYHDTKNGGCQQIVKTAVEWGRDEFDDEEIVTKWESRTCPCARYSGPEPMTQLYMPEMTGTTEIIPTEKKEKEL